LAKNEVLLRESEPYREEAQRLYEESGDKQRLFGGLVYGAKTWGLKRHVVCKAEYGPQDQPMLCRDKLDTRGGRGLRPPLLRAGRDGELIRDQMMLFADRTSATKWWANQWRMLLSALAYTLVEHIRDRALRGTELARAQCQRIRLRLFKIGTVITRTRRIVQMKMTEALSPPLFWPVEDSS
jgi:hypothetical protein